MGGERPVSDQFVDVSLCCNDPRNGNFAGRVVQLDITDWITLDGEGAAIRCRLHPTNVIQIGDLKLPYRRSVDWYGNWCWLMVEIAVPDAIRLIEFCRQRGWSCDEAESELYRVYTSGLALRPSGADDAGAGDGDVAGGGRMMIDSPETIVDRLCRGGVGQWYETSDGEDAKAIRRLLKKRRMIFFEREIELRRGVLYHFEIGLASLADLSAGVVRE